MSTTHRTVTTVNTSVLPFQQTGLDEIVRPNPHHLRDRTFFWVATGLIALLAGLLAVVPFVS